MLLVNRRDEELKMAGNKLKHSSQRDILPVCSRQQTQTVLVEHKRSGEQIRSRTYFLNMCHKLSHLRLCRSAISNIYNKKQTNYKPAYRSNNILIFFRKKSWVNIHSSWTFLMISFKMIHYFLNKSSLTLVFCRKHKSYPLYPTALQTNTNMNQNIHRLNKHRKWLSLWTCAQQFSEVSPDHGHEPFPVACQFFKSRDLKCKRKNCWAQVQKELAVSIQCVQC